MQTSFGRIFDIIAGITTVAIIALVIKNGRNTAAVISAAGEAYSQALRTAMGG
jgi:membrane DNA delivery protein